MDSDQSQVSFLRIKEENIQGKSLGCIQLILISFKNMLFFLSCLFSHQSGHRGDKSTTSCSFKSLASSLVEEERQHEYEMGPSVRRSKKICHFLGECLGTLSSAGEKAA